MKAFLWAGLSVGIIASLKLSYDISLQRVLLGAREGNWTYFYLASFGWYSLVIWAAVTAPCLLLVRATDALDRRGAWLNVVIWFFAALAIEGAICSLAPFRFDKIFESDGANAFNTVAQHYTPDTILREFEQVRKFWPPHGQSNMPGKPIFVYWLRHITRETSLLPWLVLVVSNLGGLFFYGLVKDLFNDRRTALYALILYLIVPGKMFFFPLLNVVTPLFTTICIWIAVRWLKTQNVIYAFVLGPSLYVLAAWEPLGLVIGLPIAALTLAAWARGGIAVSTTLWQLLGTAVGFAAAYALMLMRFDFDLLPTVQLLAADAAEFNVKALRPYDVWVWRNLYDFLFGVGICSAILGAFAVVDGVVRGAGVLRRLTEPVVVVTLSVLATVIVTDVIGINRGEVVRLWIFLACLAQIPAAYVCARLENRWAIASVVAVTLLHDAIATDMIGFILPG